MSIDSYQNFESKIVMESASTYHRFTQLAVGPIIPKVNFINSSLVGRGGGTHVEVPGNSFFSQTNMDGSTFRSQLSRVGRRNC